MRSGSLPSWLRHVDRRWLSVASCRTWRKRYAQLRVLGHDTNGILASVSGKSIVPGVPPGPRRTGAAGAAALGRYATLIERNAFALRETTMAVLAPGTSSLRVLHISDLHMMPNQRMKQNWLRELDRSIPTWS